MDKPIDNAQLVDAIKKLKREPNQRNEHQFIRALKQANLLVPVRKMVPSSGGAGKIETEQDMEIQIQGLQTPEGEHYISLFTDWNELNKGRYAVPVDGMVLGFEIYQKLVENNASKWMGVVINPYTSNVVLGKNQLDYIAKGAPAQSGESVMIGEPREYPKGLLEALQKTFDAMPQVEKAYFLLMVRNKTEKSYLLVLDTDVPPNDIFPKIAKETSQYLNLDQVLDFVLYNTSFGRSSTQGKVPFYTKQHA